MRKNIYMLMIGLLLLFIGCGKEKSPELEGKYHSNIYMNKELIETIDINIKKSDKKDSYKIQFITKNADETDVTEVNQEFEVLGSSKDEKGVSNITLKELGNGSCVSRYEWLGEMKELKFDKVKITTLQLRPSTENSRQKITAVFQFENENSYNMVGVGYSAVEIPLKKEQ